MDKKEQIKDLWRMSFDDSEEFIELFFDRIYKDENAMTLEKDGRIVSALHILPYTMTYYGTEISVAYIYAVCTSPEVRGQGYMRQLLEKTFKEMKYRDFALTVTIPAEPWLFDYYRKFGFTETFDYSLETYLQPEIPVDEPDLTVVEPEVPSLKSLYKFFDKKLRERSCGMLHTYDDFINILRDIELSGGQFLTALDNKEQPVGMVFLYPSDENEKPENKHVYVKELLYNDERIKNLLLQEATLQNNVKKAICRVPILGADTYRFGMACVLDTKRLIHHWNSTHEYSLQDPEKMEKMDIQSLTQLLFDYPAREAYMSLMLD